MDEHLLTAFRDTDYLVCIDLVEWACIRIEQPLPASLQRVVGERAWGFITACNPRSTVQAPADNLAAQRDLLSALQGLPGCILFAAVGIGASGWREPSLFVIGADTATLDALARAHGQHGYVCGCAHDAAQLRLLPA